MARKRLSSRKKPSFRIRSEMSMEEELDEYSNIPLGRYQNVGDRRLKDAYREGYQAGRNSISLKPDIGRLRRQSFEEGYEEAGEEINREFIRDRSGNIHKRGGRALTSRGRQDERESSLRMPQSRLRGRLR